MFKAGNNNPESGLLVFKNQHSVYVAILPNDSFYWLLWRNISREESERSFRAGFGLGGRFGDGNGVEGGIRTRDGLTPMPVFKTGAYYRSATSALPEGVKIYGTVLGCPKNT